MSELQACRVCGGMKLAPGIDLGTSAFTGVFPSSTETPVPEGRLRVVLCLDCGLAQLGDSFPPATLYGADYGYRSGLNGSMVDHLQRTVHRLQGVVTLREGDTVLDIGSNDGSLLNAYSVPQLCRIGIDPTITKFAEYYDSGILKIDDFFTADRYWSVASESARIVTSLAMFYDLEDPVEFASQIRTVLATDGIWLFEQSYMPWMLRSGAYDTICHEHLEYYSLSSIAMILQRAGLRIIDASTNAVNGGSIAVLAVPMESSMQSSEEVSAWLLRQEWNAKVSDPETWKEFARSVRDRQQELRQLLEQIHKAGKKVVGLGASTKGNVLIQSSGIDPELLPVVGDVNPDKYGKFLPGSGIPIVSEEEALSIGADYFLVLPWHFRSTFESKLRTFLDDGARVIYPLPEIEVIGY